MGSGAVLWTGMGGEDIGEGAMEVKLDGNGRRYVRISSSL